MDSTHRGNGGWMVVLVATAVTLAGDRGRAQAQPPAARATDATHVPPVARTFMVDGEQRRALVFAPRMALQTPSPIVFAFHGHGGSSRKAAESFGYHREWEEAIVVYPLGLPTPSPGDPQGEKPGWNTGGAKSGSRDLAFFDALLAQLGKDFRVDGRRIYATGTSNGGFFTYTLWGARHDVLAAVAPAAATWGRLEDGLRPKPVFHVAGERDPIVRIEAQRKTIERLRTLNTCGEGRPGRRPAITIYPSPEGNQVVAFIHDGGHEFPQAATKPIVEFFKRHALPRTDGGAADAD